MYGGVKAMFMMELVSLPLKRVISKMPPKLPDLIP